VNQDLDRHCLELAVADLRHLHPTQRWLALAQLRAIDPRLASRLQLELAYQLA
jgi:hypothetical protein